MRRLSIAFIVLLVLGALTTVWWINGTAAVNLADKTQKTFVIGKGQSIRGMANNLKNAGLIKDRIAFFVLVKTMGVENKIQAGDHRLSPSMNASQLVKALTTSTNDVWITIPEGFRAQEIADVLKKELPSFQESWRDQLEQNEGYLFPDTYLIPKTATLNSIISILKNNFDAKYATLDTKGMDKNQIVTIASLVEREAKLPDDRPLVSSVIHNRLDIGMKLDIDATVQYVLGYQSDEKRWWKKNLTTDDLKVNSPYNTYTHSGLPPTPIANPGLAALKAALNPTQTNYLYYISDKTGKNHYAATIEEHQANIQKYGL
ncbi:MAG TPA: endolytic transglycosylase MltG [Patescibacteria group bacterium]|nr:endolytic transglycosylase MltG [Patescibacteria group bacterium]